MANPRKVLEYLGLFLDRRRADFRYQSSIQLQSTQVVGLQQPAIVGGSEADRLDAVIAVMETHGLIAMRPVIGPKIPVVVPEPMEEKVEVAEKPIVVKEKKPTEMQKRRRKNMTTKRKK